MRGHRNKVPGTKHPGTQLFGSLAGRTGSSGLPAAASTSNNRRAVRLNALSVKNGDDRPEHRMDELLELEEKFTKEKLVLQFLRRYATRKMVKLIRKVENRRFGSPSDSKIGSTGFVINSQARPLNIVAQLGVADENPEGNSTSVPDSIPRITSQPAAHIITSHMDNRLKGPDPTDSTDDKAEENASLGALKQIIEYNKNMNTKRTAQVHFASSGVHA